MPTVVKFTYYHYKVPLWDHTQGLYACDQPDDQSGEHVPLAEYERLQGVLKEMMEFNPLRNDRDAYLLALSEWGIKEKWGVDEEFSERPGRADFGLE